MNLPGLDRRRFRHRRDLLVQLVVGALAARGNAEATGSPGLGSRAGFTEDLLEAAAGLMLAPAGPDNRDPRRTPPPLWSPALWSPALWSPAL